jgi:MFS family permease
MRRSNPVQSRINLLGVTFIMAWHTTLPFVAVYATSLGATPLVVGLLASASVALPLVLGIYIGAAVDALGITRVARWAAVLFVSAYGLMAAGEGLWTLAIALGIVGFADIGLVVASQTYVASSSAPGERDRNFGAYAVWVSLGSLLGPLLGGLLAAQWGYRAVFGGSLGLAVLTAVICWRLPPQADAPRTPAETSGGRTFRVAAQMLRDPTIGSVLLVNACAMFASSVRQSFYPLYLQGAGLSTTAIGALFSFNSLCAMVVRPTIGPAVRRMGHAGVLGMAMALTVVGVGVTPLLTSVGTLAVAIGLVGMGMGFMQPLSMSLVSGRAPEGTRGVALGLRITINQLAQVIGPPLLGLAVAASGLAAAFYIAAGVTGLGVPALAWTDRRSRVAAAPVASEASTLGPTGGDA